jgi:hypothetical protein
MVHTTRPTVVSGYSIPPPGTEMYNYPRQPPPVPPIPPPSGSLNGQPSVVGKQAAEFDQYQNWDYTSRRG